MSGPNPINPYEPPQADTSHVDIMPADRRWALRRIQASLLIFAILSAWNLYCFHTVYVRSNTLLILNFLGLLLLYLIGWLFALKAIEWAALILRFLLARHVPEDRWLSRMYDSLWPLPIAALLGDGVWLLWIYLTYFDGRFPWFTVSFICGAIGHLLAAWVYGTVFYNWYRLRRHVAS